MNCAVCQELIQQRLDGLEPADSASLEYHLRDCASCRALQAASGRLQRGLALLRPPSPPPALAHRITKALQAEHRSRQVRRPRLRIAWAAAAPLLLFVSGWWARSTLQPSAPPSRPNQIAETIGPAVHDDRLPEEEVDLRQSVSDVGAVVVSAATRTTDAAVAQGRAFLPMPPSTPMASLELPAMEPTRSLKEAGQGVSDGLAPVTDSARRAFDLFLRDLPPVGLEEKPGL